MIILGITYFAIVPLSCFVDCYSFYLFDEECKKDDNDTGIRIESKDSQSGIFLQSYEKEWKLHKTDCKLTISGDKTCGIALCVLIVKFTKGCKADEYLQLASPQKTVEMCSTYYGYDYQSSCYRFNDPNVTVTYKTASGVPPKFRLVANTFYNLPCGDNEFECSKEHICVWDGFLCDGINNCVDFSDELDGQRTGQCINKNKWMWMIFLSILPLVVLSLCGAAVYIIRSTGHLRATVARPEFVYISGSKPCSEVRLNRLVERRMRTLAEAERLRTRPNEEELTLDKIGRPMQSESSVPKKRESE